ncbi:hypothetical protein RHGRI_027064 [Rhododendron griersonianum]|uniref:Uncharacterized protein n=1 Tax=Rhododendron griersonianum TaxID=479676 RepID=A0AAV6J1M1_9ERIC|nr:hypothetical protein RHGRI_027064 [Rhododendron griersonianum]
MILLAILLLTVSGLLPEASAISTGIPCKNSRECIKVCSPIDIPLCLRGICDCYASKALKNRKVFSVGVDVGKMA